MKQVPGRRGERGSALLIVLVFAAVILIMLYREIPIATFEAQRQKERLTIDRGHEYQRAVQLYYRKFRGQFPAGIDQLVSTNGTRFLRRKYVDPLTGKNDWRLLHAGPGGMLTDSKVTSNLVGGASINQPQGGTGSSFGTQTQSTSTSSTSSDTSATDVTAALDGSAGAKNHHSAPAIVASGAGTTGGADSGISGVPNVPTSAQLNSDPSQPLLPSTTDSAAAAGSSSNGNLPGAGATTGATAGGSTQNPANTAGFNGQSQPGLSNVSQNGPHPINGTTLGGAGGVAGVACVIKGSSIKKVNEQDEYSKWEFYYDPSKDTGMNGGGTQANNLQGVAGGGLQQTQQTNGSSSGFNSGPNAPSTPTSPNPNSPGTPSQ